MTTPVQTAQHQQERQQGLIASTLSLPFRIFGILMLSLLASILIEYLGIAFFWPDQGWRHSQAMFNAELGWLSSHFRQSLLLHEPGKTMAWLVGEVYDWLFVRTGFIEFAQQARQQSQMDNVTGLVSRLYVVIEDYAVATLYVVLTFVVRLVVLVLATPLFMLATFTGAVDGLMRRDLRKFGAGRESSFVYHRAKRLLLPLLVAPWLIYLALPISVNPVWVLLPCAGMLGVAMAVTAATFKKYL